MLLTACIPLPLVMGGAVLGGGGLIYADRRTTGIQLEDEGIELRAAARARDLATLGHVSVTSYNRTLLITGEVPTEADKAAVGEALSKVENVKAVVNELGIGPSSTVGSRSTDAYLATKIKAQMVDSKDLIATAFKVVVERAEVYLMGRVTAREAARAAEVARSVKDVQKVVRVFEILSEEELANLGRPAAPVSTATQVPVPVSPAPLASAPAP
jgi:osmotically-inducible protein OsmY